MKCLVTGGTGFIGCNLAIKLLEEGHQVIVIGSPKEQKIPNLKAKYLPKNLGDLKLLSELDVLFHQGAITDTTLLDRNKMFDTNVEWSKKLFNVVLERGCRHIVYASSTAVYGNMPAPYIEDITPLNPLNPYAESKKLLEEFAQEFAAQNPAVVLVGLRYCNVYGQRENHKKKSASMIYQLAQQMVNGNPKIFRGGEQKRDYIYIDDIVRANLLASQSQKSTILNCGCGKATTFNNLIEILNSVMDINRKPEYIENPYEGKYQNHTQCDMTKARQELEFIPEFDIEAGIKEYYKSGYLTK